MVFQRHESGRRAKDEQLPRCELPASEITQEPIEMDSTIVLSEIAFSLYTSAQHNPERNGSMSWHPA
jgi:hypothetical protein